MSTELIVNSRPWETRVALVENGVVLEFYIEREKGEGIAGNIYKGKVIRVLPGMQAAFVDIGLEKAAFLYVTDVFNDFRDIEMLMLQREGEEKKEEEFELDETAQDFPGERVFQETPFQIQELVREGQEMLVQIAKEPLGTKGARVTTHISLPGRNLVLMPLMDHVGVSRRIEDEDERQRVKELINELKPEGFGFIVRTAGEGAERDKFESEMQFLVKLWSTIQKNQKTATAPQLIHKDLSITLRSVRDLFTKEVDRLIIDSREEYENALRFVRTFMPRLSNSVEHYDDGEPIFDRYGIEMEVSRALNKKVWLKSGGYIVIEMTEALVSIDVNTGRFVGKRNLEETILKTNLEAVKEIAYQLRLRNIGGLIVIDFIDMERESDREKVFNALKEALHKDKSKTSVAKMSEFGLIEMTRKRTRENINRFLSEDCFYCDGRGALKSATTICYDILRGIEREAHEIPGQNLYLRVHPEISELLLDEENQHIAYLERRIKKSIVIRSQEGFHFEQFSIGAY